MSAMGHSAHVCPALKRALRGRRCRCAARSAAAVAGHDDRPSQDTSGLTPIEIDVLRLIAAGRSNRQSPRTVERHIANIYLKIDAHNKAEATAWAFRHGLA